MLPGLFAATGAVAIDRSGRIVFAYTFSTQANGPKALYVRTSDDGAHWGPTVLVNALGDSNVPQIDNGPVLTARRTADGNQVLSPRQYCVPCR